MSDSSLLKLQQSGRQLIAVAAIDLRRGIGLNNLIPWGVPADRRFFRRLTVGHVLIMGRKTYESIGYPLPDRDVVVLSQSGFRADGIRVFSDWESLIGFQPGRKLFVVGGANVYEQTLPFCSELILTHIELEVESDVFFPDWRAWFDDGEVIEQHSNCVMKRHRRLVI